VIAVCLLTAGRLAYTATTVTTFTAQNAGHRFGLLLHADDASADPAVPSLPVAYGFETVYRSPRRQGWLEMRRKLFAAAKARGAAWVLFLENDIEWARPFPWPLFDYVASKPDIYCLRLQGAFKGKGQTDPCMTYHKADRRAPVRWRRLKFAPERAQVGRIHWSAQPSVTRIEPLLDLHTHGMDAPALTARVVENVTYHVGLERTVTRPAPALAMEASA